MGDSSQNTGTKADRPAGLQGWFQELRRRHIFKVTAAYLVLAWLLMQVASVLETSLGLPPWSDKLTFAILVIGFPIAIFVTWAVDLTPNTATKTSSDNTIGEASAASSDKPGSGARSRKMDEKSSIAVLPFDNISGDSEQDYISDGLTADVIAGLSRIRSFFVISRNSTSRYKGSSYDARQVARDLNVQYILGGSLSRSGVRLRVAVELIDAANEHSLWSQRFEREFSDIFAIRDEVTQNIVAQLEPELSRAEYERTKAARSEVLDAWELFHRAAKLVSRRTKEDLKQARELLNRSLEINHNFASAHAAIAWSMGQDRFFQYVKHDPKVMMEHGRKAVELDDKDPFSYVGLAWALTYDNRPEDAIVALQKALELNPSYSYAHDVLGRLLVHTGQMEAGIAHVELASRLNPLDIHRGQATNVIATGYLYLKNYEKAVMFARQVTQTFDTWVPWMIITSAFGHMGDATEAAKALEEMRKRKADVSLETVRQDYLVYDDTCREQLLYGLRMAGLPEHTAVES